jgi:hypothetical protein
MSYDTYHTNHNWTLNNEEILNLKKLNLTKIIIGVLLIATFFLSVILNILTILSIILMKNFKKINMFILNLALGIKPYILLIKI